jgi:hypothetical protein
MHVGKVYTNFDLDPRLEAVPAPKEIVEMSKGPFISMPKQECAVNISGRGLLLSRRFALKEGQPEPAVQTTHTSIYDRSVDFLNEQDRQLLSEMYAYACEKGIHLRYVDAISSDLEDYRGCNSGKSYPINDGGMFVNHHASYIDFGPHEAEVADRILASKELDHTYLDQGFLVYRLNREKTVLHATNFDFLEKMVRVFSPDGDRVGEDFEAFRQYTPVIAKELPRYYRSKEPDREMVESDARQKLGASDTQSKAIPSIGELTRNLIKESQEGRDIKLEEFKNFYFASLFSFYFHMKQLSLKASDLILKYEALQNGFRGLA